MKKQRKPNQQEHGPIYTVLVGSIYEQVYSGTDRDQAVGTAKEYRAAGERKVLVWNMSTGRQEPWETKSAAAGAK